MKRFLTLILVLLLLCPTVSLAAKDGNGWTDGVCVLGDSGYKLILPDDLYPVEKQPNEFAAACTKSYSSAGDMGIVVGVEQVTPFDYVNAMYQYYASKQDSNFTITETYIANESETALDDWLASLNTNEYDDFLAMLNGKGASDYIEANGFTLDNNATPYVLSLNNHLGNHAIQASFVFAVPTSEGCYTIFISKLLDAGTMPQKETIEQFRNDLILGVGSLLANHP